MAGTKNISAPKTPFQSINTSDKDLSKVQDAIVQALAEVDKRFAQYMNALVPVGAILDWHKNLPGMPALPPNFLECNGQKIVDDRSPLNGSTLEDLNGQGYFTRAGKTSGVIQAADTVVVVPAHAHSMQAHTHDMNAHTHGAGSYTVNVKNTPNSATGAAGSGVNILGANNANYSVTGTSAGPSVASTLGPSVANTATDGGSTSGTETRPKNVAYVKVMRIW